jgi:hypothetical protein
VATDRITEIGLGGDQMVPATVIAGDESTDSGGNLLLGSPFARTLHGRLSHSGSDNAKELT